MADLGFLYLNVKKKKKHIGFWVSLIFSIFFFDRCINLGFQQSWQSDQRAPVQATRAEIRARDLTCNMREQDRYLPIMNINRIMQKVLPVSGYGDGDSFSSRSSSSSSYSSSSTGRRNF